MADIKKIATLAVNIKPASKKQAFETVLDIIENGPTNKALAVLYSYFLPKQPHKAKTTAAWLVRALAGKKNMRKYLQHVFCDGGRLMATDEARLHVAPAHGLAKGFYDKALSPVELDERFPDVTGVIITACRGEPHSLDSLKEIPSGYKHGKHVFILPNGAFVQCQYWLDAVRGEAGIAYLSEDKEAPVGVELVDGRLAVIMPMRQ